MNKVQGLGEFDGWEEVNLEVWSNASKTPSLQPETIQERIVRFTVDERDLETFHAVSFSPTRMAALEAFYTQESADLDQSSFPPDQQGRVDFILLRKYINRSFRRLHLQRPKTAEVLKVLPFLESLVQVIEARQNVSAKDLEPRALAQRLHDDAEQVTKTRRDIENGTVKCDKMTGYRALKSIQELRAHLEEFHGFFNGYSPLYDWFVSQPYQAVLNAIDALVPVVEVKLAGMRPEDKDEIIGVAIGREGLLDELEAEVIPYTPEQLLVVAKRQYAWCEREAKRAADELGFGNDWRAALEHVKNMYLAPGEQPAFIKDLLKEGTEYVKSRDLVTVPPMAEQTWRMFMMSPEAQKVNPFFLGGKDIIVSYPTVDMSHADKLMSLRGNNKPMSRATVFHEMIPGHHLQLFMSARHRPYRRLFTTPFYVEGWAMYWEMVLWNNGDFFTKPEDRIGSLFWRMHRCARIIFSLRFHLGQMTPQECVDLLVDMVGHERATAEGEVRRSLNGDYSPLYQAGYMLGALQLHSLRTEVLEDEHKRFTEKQFHDFVLRSSEMPIEMLRALVLDSPLTRDYKAQWMFQGRISTPFGA